MTRDPDLRPSGMSVLEAWRLVAKPAWRQPAPRQPNMGYAGTSLIIGLLNLGALAALAALAVPDPPLAAIGGLIHTAIVPGLLLAFIVLPRDEVDLAEWLVLGAGLALLVLVVGGLVLTQVSAKVGPGAVVIWSSVMTLGLGAVAFKQSLSWRVPPRGDGSSLRDIALLIVLAGALRVPGLGYSEFQGDETEVMLRAVGAVQGLPDALFYHGKGPGEIVTVTMLYGLIGAINEAAARLPFALAGIGGVLAFYLLARRLVGRAGALVAGLLLATNGFLLAFSRITQYQSLVLLLGTLAVWCAVRWAAGGSDVWPVLAGAFAAGAALAHYDALFVLPPIALAFSWRGGWRALRDRQTVMPWLYGAAVGAAILSAFFIPYLTSPLFGLATGRIADRVGAGFPHNNVPAIVAAGALYLGTVWPTLVAPLIVLGGVAWVIRRPETPPARVWLLGLVWAAVPFLFYAIVARKPGTHVHVVSSGLALLAGAGFATVWALLARSSWRIAFGGLVGAGLALVGAYLVPVYLQQSPEVVRADRALTLPLAWAPPGGPPKKERFGFPYEVGWKAIGALYADGTLAGSYESNEQPQVSFWYTRGAWRCSADPRYYVIAENVQDEIETPRRAIASQYHPVGTVTVGGETKLRVFERGPSSGAAPAVWPVETFAPRFDRPLSAPTFDPGVWSRGVFARDGQAAPLQLGEAIDLLGYQVLAEDARPGGVVRVDLFWLPHLTTDGGYRIDVQLGRDPRIGDGGGPACDKTRADQEWQAGQPFVQRLSIPISADAPAGPHPLLVSVSENGGGPLQATGPTGTTANPAAIGEVEVRAR
jgi:4-amino-4-deoxy-L-arabinose transferase-like glycosyltransferase